MNSGTGTESNRNVLTVSNMPHYAPYLQFLVSIIQIHFEQVKQGFPDYKVTEAFIKDDLDSLYEYLLKLETGAPVEIKENDARVLYASFVIVSRLLLCEYGEEICQRLIKNLPIHHRWFKFENFRNDLLRHNAQMLMDMDANMSGLISGLDAVKAKLEVVSL
jgi:hypothetical protein